MFVKFRIGLIVVTIVILAIIFAPKIASLLAFLVPATNADPDNQTQDNPIASTYTENDYIDDCIEIVQEKLLASTHLL